MIRHVLRPIVSLVSAYGQTLFSSPGRSLGKAIVLPPASALVLALAEASPLAKGFTSKFFYVMDKALSGELSCPCDRSCSFSIDVQDIVVTT